MSQALAFLNRRRYRHNRKPSVALATEYRFYSYRTLYPCEKLYSQVLTYYWKQGMGDGFLNKLKPHSHL